jgi:acetyl esterase/lipase
VLLSWEGALRLLWAAGALALALLAVFAAPANLLWKAAVGVTEWGHMLWVGALLPLLPGWRRSWPGRAGGALGLGAVLLFLSPLARAMPVALALPGQLAAAFGPPRAPLGRPAPLVAADLIRGVARPAVAPSRLIYATRSGVELGLDFYPAQAAGPAPLVVMIHGGAWASGSSQDLPALNGYLAGRGYAVAAISYRLAPTHPFPAARDDVTAAVAFLKERAAELAIDPTRIALIGRSAGGHLALLAGYASPDPAIRGIVAFYSPIDLRYGYANPRNPAVIDSRAMLGDFLGGSPELAGAAYDAASPIRFVGPDTPPTLLIHGIRDEVVSFAESAMLDEKLAAAGRPHLLLALPWATHGMDFNFDGPGGQLSTYAVEHFLSAVLR